MANKEHRFACQTVPTVGGTATTPTLQLVASRLLKVGTPGLKVLQEGIHPQLGRGRHRASVDGVSHERSRQVGKKIGTSTDFSVLLPIATKLPNFRNFQIFFSKFKSLLSELSELSDTIFSAHPHPEHAHRHSFHPETPTLRRDTQTVSLHSLPRGFSSALRAS